MTAAILCPGPSLPHTWKPDADFAGLTIAVNRTATAYPCDFWAALDFPLVLKVGSEVKNAARLFTTRESLRSLDRHGDPWAFGSWTKPGVVCAESLFDFLPATNLPWTTFTMTAAMVLAASRGAEQIDIFGCDWSHEPDWDGNADALENREEHRWDNERGIYQRLVDVLHGRGCEVRRITKQ